MLAIFIRPHPFLFEFRVEGIGVFHAFDVTARAWIAVPIPGPTHPVTGLEDFDVQAEFAKSIEGVKSRKSGADNNG